MTGDTSYAGLRQVQSASIIVTTPEKWDSVTRKWKDHRKLMELVKLFLIDEVHTVNDPRGATLESVVSRMRSIGSQVRFVALSATVPNASDVATWLGKDSQHDQEPAVLETFGEEFRPVKIQKVVQGYSAGLNQFSFDKSLNAKCVPSLMFKKSTNEPKDYQI
jgi:ATP-dependent DNA helicase HFM1/MER3